MIAYKWKPIEPMDGESEDYDFSEIDSLQQQWLDVKGQVEGSTPQAYKEFMDRLGRSWAIETGILEGLYVLDRGVTETLVEKGLLADYIERSSTDKEPLELIAILRDHQTSVDFVYDWIRESRPLTKWFIRALHTRLTDNQDTFQAVNQFGKVFNATLNKGTFKTLPNNPSRPDGTVHEYCPPEQVDSEIDNLLYFYEESREEGYHPLLLAAWLHHKFTQIHPFQDGNGRVVRALLTWHLVREGFLPIVISRESRSDYIDALENADAGKLAPLIDLIVELEKSTILQALSSSEPELITEVPEGRGLVDQVIDHIVDRVERQRQAELSQMRSVNNIALNLRHEAKDFLNLKSAETSERLKEVDIFVSPRVVEGGPDQGNEHWYRGQVLDTAHNAQHWVNFSEPRYFVKLSLNPPGGSRNPHLSFVISLHHIGHQLTGIMATTAFAEIEYYEENDDHTERSEWGRTQLFEDCTVSPFTFTWKNSELAIQPRFMTWTERCLSVALKYWGGFIAETSSSA